MPTYGVQFNNGTAFSVTFPDVAALLALCDRAQCHLAEWDHVHKGYLPISPAQARAMWQGITTITTDDQRIDPRYTRNIWHAHYVLDATDATAAICGPLWHYKGPSHAIQWYLELGLHYTPTPLPTAALVLLQAVSQ